METRHDAIVRILYRLCAGEFITQTFDNPLQEALNEAELMELIENYQGVYRLTKGGNIFVNSGKTYEQFLQEQNNQSHKIHVEHSQNTIIGQSNSSFEKIRQTNNAPINIPTPKATKSQRSKSTRSLIIAIVAGIVVVLFVVFLKSCGVNAQIIIHK